MSLGNFIAVDGEIVTFKSNDGLLFVLSPLSES